MVKKELFLKWSLLNVLIVVGVIIANTAYGIFSMINHCDATKISFIIIAIFTAATLWFGYIAWRADHIFGMPVAMREDVERLEAQTDHCWYAMALCEKFGLLGTIFGFILALIGGFQNFHNADEASVRALMEHLSLGLSTAFVTTLVGLICSILLSVMCHYSGYLLRSRRI